MVQLILEVWQYVCGTGNNFINKDFSPISPYYVLFIIYLFIIYLFHPELLIE